MSSRALHQPPSELILPRYGTPRRLARPTNGALVGNVAALLGWTLHSWQAYASDVSMEYQPISRLPYYQTICLAVARQNGKTLWRLVRIALQLLVPRSTVAYTAQDRNIARFKWAEDVEILMSTPFAHRVRHVSRINGSEALIMNNGSQYIIVTPDPEKAGRSMSLDLAVIDEAFAQHNLELVGALRPTMAARPYAQLLIMSNAGDETSVLWQHYTELGRASIDNPLARLCWLEWASDEDADVWDRQAWAEANPSLDLPHGVTSEYLEAAVADMVPATFRREHLNLWSGTTRLLSIDPETWAARRSTLAPGDRVALGLQFTPERDRGALVSAGNIAGVTPIEVLEVSDDLDRLVTRAGEVANNQRAEIIIDRTSPAASAIPALERATKHGRGKHEKNRVRVIPSTEVARACGDFYDAVIGGRLTHQADPRLTDAVAAATRVKLGRAWVWNPESATLLAATVARWGAVTAPPPETPAVAEVHSPAARRLRAVPGAGPRLDRRRVPGGPR